MCLGPDTEREENVNIDHLKVLDLSKTQQFHIVVSLVEIIDTCEFTRGFLWLLLKILIEDAPLTH